MQADVQYHKASKSPKETSVSRYEPFRYTIVIQIYKKKFDCTNRRAIIHLEECFICEKQASRSELHEAMTMQLNTRLHQCAQNLQDQKLLAKLSEEMLWHKS
jgi:transcription initiation factor IIE alpha subunit